MKKKSSSRTQLRKMMREHINVNERVMRTKYGIPKAFASHAANHGKDVADMVQEMHKYPQNRIEKQM